MTDITLSAGKLRLVLSPSVGGAISAFEWVDDAAAARPMRRSRVIAAARSAAIVASISARAVGSLSASRVARRSMLVWPRS